MPRNKNILLILFLSLASLSNAQEKQQGQDLAAHISKYGQVELSFKYPGFDELNIITRKVPLSGFKDGKVYAVLSGKDLEVFLSLGLQYDIISPDKRKSVESAGSVQEAMNWDLYPTYQQYDSIVHKLAADHPSLCTVDTIGYSIEGRLILALKISDNVNEDEDEPEVFYSSNIHGDELQGYVLMLRLAEYLLDNASDGGSVQALTDSLEIWINPLANPDGTYHGGDTISYPVRANANGTDLNRNFPDPMDPFIVPDVENAAMIDFMRERNFVLSANFHSGFEVVNYPWDRWYSKNHADSAWFYYISRRYSDTVHNHSVSAYMDSYDNGVVRGADWYIIYGGRQDFITYELQGREVTVELDDTKQTPASQLPLLWDYNYRSLTAYLENAFFGLHGKVLADDTGEALEARIFIDNHDKDSSHVYSEAATGSFVRLLSPGTWDLRISAEGYETKVISDLVLTAGQQRYITVRLTGASLSEPLQHENEMTLWPVPASSHIFVATESFRGSGVSIRIYNQLGMSVYSSDNIFIDNDKLKLDISALAPGYYIISLSRPGGGTSRGRFFHY